MAYLTVNSTFNPYTFDELIKPFAMYDTAYKEQEAYLDAARELDASGGMYNQETTPVAYGMYSSANDSLRAISDELATNGLSSDLKSRLRSTVRDYRSTMKTLNTAQERYYAEQDRRAKLGPDYVFQQGNLSVDDFLGGKTPNQRGESLKDITSDIATQFSARAQQITRDTWNKVLGNNGKVIGGYYDVTTESGLTAAQLDTILNTDDKTWNSILNNSGISSEQKSILQGFRNTITRKLDNIGYNAYDEYSRGKIDEAIAIGATGALGGTTHKYVQDPGYDPLGWQKYNDAKAQNLLELRLKYPYYQFDDKGDLVVDKNGSPVVSSGWNADENGNWKGPNGQILATNKKSGTGSETQRYPDVKILYFDGKGNVSRYNTDNEFNTANSKVGGELVTEPGMLSEENKKRLATVLGLNALDSEEYLLEEAGKRGIYISVVGSPTVSKKVKNQSGKKESQDVSNAEQQMIIRGTTTFIGNSSPEVEASTFDENG